MSSEDRSADYTLLTRLADEFAARYRAGERPSLQEFIDRHPALAEEILELFPAMFEIEQVKEDHQNAVLHGGAPPAPALRQLGDYRIIREIGHGGMGIVYEAEQVSLGRHVALKVLPHHALKDAKQKRRFEREARAAARLHHTNIVPVFGVGEHDGMPYFVMQYIQGLGLDAVLDGLNQITPGGSIAGTDGQVRFSRHGATATQMARTLVTGTFQRVEASSDEKCSADAVSSDFDAPREEEDSGRPRGDLATTGTSPRDTDTPHPDRLWESSSPPPSSLSFPGTSNGGTGRKTGPGKETYWHRVAGIGRQVADALDYAHKQGILHRDVKPSNLLLDMRGTVWVADFGLAKVAGPGAEDLTHTGDIVGTLRYMSPESFEGKNDARSDVYSLGLTLYELLAMRPAFPEKDRNKLIKMVTAAEPMRLDKVKPEVPRDLVTIVQKAIEREPLRRYATAEELAADLQRYIDDEPIQARRQTKLETYVRWTRHNPGIAALCAVLAAVLVTATIASVIVAGRMSTLADEAKGIADEERKARRHAQESEKREAQERERAEDAKKTAQAAEEEGRKLLYATDMQLAPFVWRDDRTAAEQLRLLLAKHVPEERMKDQTTPGVGSDSSLIPHPSSLRTDLRGFEWDYYHHVLESGAAIFSGHDVSVVGAAFAVDGQLVTLDQNGQVRHWDLDWQVENGASRLDLPGGSGARIRVLSPDGRLAAVAQGNKVHVIETATGNETFQIDSVDSPHRHLIISRDGDRLVIIDDKIRWCNTVSGKVLASANHELSNVESLALSDDGLTLAVVGQGEMRQLVAGFRLDADAKKVTPLAKDVGNGGTLRVAALTRDGRQLVVGAKISGTLSVFDTSTGRSIAQLGSAHASPVAAMAFSGDGTKLATADAQGTIKIWADAQKLDSKSVAILTKKGHRGTVTSVGFSADGKRLVTTGTDKTARVWDLEDGATEIRPLEVSGASGVARFSPDGQLIASVAGNPRLKDAAAGSSLRLWDAATGRLVRELSVGSPAQVHSVAFSPTDYRLLAVGYGGQDGVSYVALWDIDAGTELTRLPGATDLPDFRVDKNTGVVAALAFSPDGKYLVAGFGTKYVYTPQAPSNPLKVWDVATRREIRRLNGHTGYCVSLDFSPDGTLLASGSRDGTAILWSTATWKATRTLHNPDQPSLYSQAGWAEVEDVAFSPDGKTLALASFEGTVQLWDVAGGKLIESLKGHPSAVSAVVFSPDGRTLASGGGDQTLRLWNVATRRELMQLDHGITGLGHVRTLAFSSDGKQLLAGGSGTAVWSITPIVWNDPDQAADKLQLLLKSNAGFQSRIRMLSEHLLLHKALTKLDAKDKRVRAALAATQANWHASRKAWAEAVAAYDRLVAADPSGLTAWLRTPGLLRVATALLHQNRPAVAAMLLQGGAKRRTQDGLPAIVGRMMDEGGRMKDEGGPPKAEGKPTDQVTKASPESLAHPSSLIPHPFQVDQLNPLRSAVDERLAKEPRDAGVLELRAELAGQWSDAKAQVADYTAAIEALAQQKPDAVAADLKRLYARRANAYVALRQWRPAIDDYARVVTAVTTDDTLLSNQALARAETMLTPAVSSDLAAVDRERKLLAVTKLADPWQKLAAAYRLKGDQHAIDRLVDQRPKSAGPIGDLFTQGKDEEKDWRRAISLYSKGITAGGNDVELLSKRARAYAALKNWEAAAADWSRAATLDPEGRKRLAELARRLAAAGQVPLAKAQLEKSRALYERSLEADPDNDLLVPELVQLLWDQRENEVPTPWSVLEPTKMESEGGATLTLQRDGSILASGKSPDRDVYTIVARPGLEHITAIRLEALPDPSLPDNGPGRDPSIGNFYLNELRIVSGGAQVPLTGVIVEYDEFRESQKIIDGRVDGSAGWANAGNLALRNTAIVSLQLRRSHDDELRIELHSPIRSAAQHTLGRFRLSARGAPATFDRERERFAAMKITDPWAKLAATYHVIGDQSALDRLLKNHPAAASGIGDLFAAVQDWERAVAEYSKAITPDAKDADLFARRAEAYEELGRREQAIADWGKADLHSVDRNKRYRSYPPIVRRAGLYERLRQWDKATADYSQAVRIAENPSDPLIWRASHWARQGQWKKGADDYRQARSNRTPEWYFDWNNSRDRAVLNLLAGNFDGYRQAAAEMLASTDGIVDAEPSHWLVTVFVLAPDTITDANRDRLLAAADRVVDSYWKPRLEAALRFRHGDYREAAKLFEQNFGGNAFEFLFAMAEHELGHAERARELFNQGTTLIQEQRDRAPGGGVPPGQGWLEWAIILRLQREAARKLASTKFTDLDARLKAEPGHAGALLERARLLATMGLCEDALADLDRMAPPAMKSADYLGLRGRALASLNRGDEALAGLNQAIASGSTDAQVYAARGKIIGKRRETGPARKDLEKSLDIDPSEQTAKLLAGFLLDQEDNEEATRWTVLKPTTMKSEGGATLTLQPDGSILASGKNPDRDVYNLVARPGLEHIIALRLEALPDPSLPSNGPGRSPSNGNFQLNEWRVFSGGQPCALTEILVAFDEVPDSPKVIDGKTDESLGWGNFPRSGLANTATVLTRLDRAPDDDLKMEMVFCRLPQSTQHNLGRFRLSASGDSAAFDRERRRLAAMKLADPWAQLAAAYHLVGDDRALAKVLKYHPAAVAGLGDLYAADHDWARAIAAYRKGVTADSSDRALLAKLADAYRNDGRTREGIAYLAMASAANPSDTMFSLKVAALQAWFGQEKELAATRQRVLAYANGTSEATTADRAAKACSLLPSTDKAVLEAALALARAGVKLSNGGDWFLMALGMAEYRSGNDAAAEKALLAAVQAGPNNRHVTGTSAFYRAMSLFRQGKKDEARKLAIAAAAELTPPLNDKQISLSGGAGADDLILWLAYKEAIARIKFDTAPFGVRVQPKGK